MKETEQIICGNRINWTMEGGSRGGGRVGRMDSLISKHILSLWH